MASTRDAANHGVMQGALIAALSAGVLAITSGAETRSAPPSFHLVFDGKHNAALLHEGTFGTSSSFCPSGSAADVGVEATSDTALRRFECADGSTFSARVAPLPAEHGGIGSWQIVDGTGPLANLRGKGTFASTRLAGRQDDPATITFRSTWDGVADFDSTPPVIGLPKTRVRKLKRPKGAYTLRVVLSLTDNDGDAVTYVLQVADTRKSLIYKVGKTATGTLTVTFRIRPTKGTRSLRCEIDASDAVGNEAKLAQTIRLK